MNQKSEINENVPHVTFFQRMIRTIYLSNVLSVIVERLVRKLYPIEKITRRQFTVHNFNGVFQGTIDNYIEYQIFFFGGYDIAGLILSREIIRKLNCKNIVDIGANVGNHAIFYSQIADNVYCFEPNPMVIPRLIGNIMNSCVNNVIIYDFALSDKNGKLRFFQNAGRNFGAGSFERNHDGIDLNSEQFLITKRGDDILPDICKNIDFVKIDVEGHEHKVLEGMRKCAETMRPVFDFEFSNTLRRGVGNEASLRKLFPVGYTLLGAVERNRNKIKRIVCGRELILEKFLFDRTYSHAFAIPDEKISHIEKLIKK